MHPLDPLTADEVAAAARRALAAQGLSDRVRVVSVELREPDKADYLAWKAGGPPPPREAFCVLLDQARRRGVEAVVPLGGGDVAIADLPYATDPLVLVVGSEGKGLSRLVREQCDAIASIPIASAVESLNAGVAAGIALFEVARQRAS